MKPKIKVAFASGPDDLNRELVERMTALFPELPLYVVSEFPPHTGRCGYGRASSRVHRPG